MIYASDTNTNVCPSMHVIGSFAAMFSVFDCKRLRRTIWAPAVAVALTILISHRLCPAAREIEFAGKAKREFADINPSCCIFGISNKSISPESPAERSVI